jgi:hypothetical protein
VNGKSRWQQTLSPENDVPHAFDILLYDLPEGANIDLVVVGNAPVRWKAQLLAEPCTEFRPNLTIGPVFSDSQKVAQRTAGADLLSQISVASAGGARNFVVPPGDYRFSGSEGSYPHLKDLNGITISAYGATFWFEPPLINGLEFDDCRNVTVKGLTLDCDPLPFFQARITAVNSAAGTVTAELMPGYDPGETGGRRTVSFYHPDGSYIRNRILGCTWSRRPDSDIVDIAAPAPGVSDGDYLACVIRTGQQLRSINCGGMTFQDVNIYSGGGMAVYESGGPGGSRYLRVRCTRRPGTNRLHAFGADGFHFSGVGKGPLLDRCEGAYFADDEVNVHGQFGSIVSTIAPDHYLLSCVNGSYFPGQRLDFWGFVELEPLGNAIVTAAQKSSGDNTWDVMLSVKLVLPANVLIDTHQQTSGGYVIKNCWFHDTGQRFLINGAPNGVIENNTFQNIGGGISIHNESWNGYTEGAFPSGTLFARNRLLNTEDGIMLTVNPGGRSGRGIRRSLPIKNVTISGNYIDTAGPDIDADQTDGLKIEDNVFDHPFREIIPPNRYTIDDSYGDPAFLPIRVAAVNNALIADNLVYDPDNKCGGTLVVLGPLTTEITVNGEPQWDAAADTFSCWYPQGQGSCGWYYGTVGSSTGQAENYNPAVFTTFPSFDSSIWKLTDGQYPFISKTGEHPSVDHAVVRRWISAVEGLVRLIGVTQTPDSGDGTIVGLYVNGDRIWQQDNSDHRVHSFDIPIPHLKIGSIVDIVVDAKGNMNGDFTTLYAKVLTPPSSYLKTTIP